MRSCLVIFVTLIFCQCISQAGEAPYQMTKSFSNVQWVPLDGTRVQVDWKEGTPVRVPRPNKPFNMFGIDFPVDDSVEVLLQGNGTFQVFTPQLLVLADGLFGELDSATPGANIQYKYESTMDGGVLRLRYDSVSLAQMQEQNFVSFEIRIHYGSGEIEFFYGPSSENTRSISVVLAQPFVGISLQSPDFYNMYEKIWLYGNPDAPSIDSTRTVAFPPLTGMPSAGTVFSFRPTIATSVHEDPNHNPDRNFNPDPTKNSDAWRNANVEVLDLLGRTILSTITTADGNLPRGVVTPSPVIIRNTSTNRTRLVLVQ